MAGDGTTYTIDLDVPQSGIAAAEAAARAVTDLADQLEVAGAASEAAANAVKAGEAAYKSAETAADRAAKAVEKIGLAAEAQRAKMKAAMDSGNEGAFWRAAAAAEKLNERQVEAAAAAAKAQAALQKEAQSLDALKTAAAQAAAKEEQLGKAHAAAKKTSDAMAKAQQAAAGSGKINEIAEGFGKLGGPLGQVGQKALGAVDGVKKLVAGLGEAGGPYAAVAIAAVALVAAIAAVTAAAIAGVAAILKWSVSLSDAARSQQLLIDGIAGSVKGGAELGEQIADLTRSVPLSSDEITKLAADLRKTGLEGAELGQALKKAAYDAASAKFGPEWSKQLLSLDKQSQTFKGHLSDLFKLNIEPLLEGLSRIVALFDAQSETGRAIKVVFQDIFQKLIDWLVELEPKIVKAFIQFEIWVLKALIAIKPFGSKIVMLGEAFAITAAIIVGLIATVLLPLFVMIVGPIMLVVGAIWLLVYACMELYDGCVRLAKAIGELADEALGWLKQKFDEVVSYLENTSLAQIGADMINGLVEGIKSGAGAILSAMTGAVGGAIDGAKKLLGIASPSKVFAEIGMNTAEGMAVGVDASADQVQGSMESMMAPPDVAGGASPAAIGKGGHTFQISIQAPSGDAPSIAAEVRKVILEVLEGDVTQVGSEVAA